MTCCSSSTEHSSACGSRQQATNTFHLAVLLTREHVTIHHACLSLMMPPRKESWCCSSGRRPSHRPPLVAHEAQLQALPGANCCVDSVSCNSCFQSILFRFFLMSSAARQLHEYLESVEAVTTCGWPTCWALCWGCIIAEHSRNHTPPSVTNTTAARQAGQEGTSQHTVRHQQTPWQNPTCTNGLGLSQAGLPQLGARV